MNLKLSHLAPPRVPVCFVLMGPFGPLGIPEIQWQQSLLVPKAESVFQQGAGGTSHGPL